MCSRLSRAAPSWHAHPPEVVGHDVGRQVCQALADGGGESQPRQPVTFTRDEAQHGSAHGNTLRIAASCLCALCQLLWALAMNWSREQHGVQGNVDPSPTQSSKSADNHTQRLVNTQRARHIRPTPWAAMRRACSIAARAVRWEKDCCQCSCLKCITPRSSSSAAGSRAGMMRAHCTRSVVLAPTCAAASNQQLRRGRKKRPSRQPLQWTVRKSPKPVPVREGHVLHHASAKQQGDAMDRLL